eukprot:TRINITY_DN28848_c0_g1_i1.p1 TRINITY_DN28848_c0_g1~~TRINITY_DN28848_c0_g1_i1.p1  ORF type:complete len:489 (+),score=60.45 TRINITY_DN28848_c0_g1_i1:62-1528(+)
MVARELRSVNLLDDHAAAPSWRKDIWDLLLLTGPLFLSRVSFVVMKTTDSSMLGHVGTRYLDAAALSDLWTSSTGVLAQSYAAGVFCSNAYGAGNKKLVGIWVQVAWAVLLPICALVMGLWCLTGLVLRALGNGEQVSSDANYFAMVLMCCLPVRVIFSQLGIFFSAQKILKPSATCSTFGMLANLAIGLPVVFGIPFTSFKGFGFTACPWVTTMVEYMMLALSILWFCGHKQLHRECWAELSIKNVTKDRVRSYLGQYVPQTLSLASDFWRVAAIGAIADSMDEHNVGVWNTGYRICWISLTFCGSLAGAMGIKLGNALGKGDARLAQREAKVGMTLCVSAVGLLALIIVCIPRYCGMLFSSDPVLLDLFEESRFAFALFVGLMNLAVVLEKIPTMVGRSSITFWMGVVGSWVGQVPGAYFCTHYWRKDLYGLYAGSAAGYALLCALLAIACVTLDWTKLAEEARRRAEVAPVREERQATCEEGNED